MGLTCQAMQCVAHAVASLQVASWLLDHNADVNQQDDFGRSPLHYAATWGHADAVDLLAKCAPDMQQACLRCSCLPRFS